MSPTLVFFRSARSGRCRVAEAHLAQVLQRNGNHDTFRLVHVDVEERPDLAARFGIATVPTFIVLDERRIAARVAEPSGAREISAALRPWLHGSTRARRAAGPASGRAGRRATTAASAPA